MMKPTVAFQNFANAPKNERVEDSSTAE